MRKLNNIIRDCKKLIDLPYNKFNLDNYLDILSKQFGHINLDETPNDLPIKLMSGNHKNSGIVKNKQKGKIYIIGKGILFDSGGMDLKPRGNMTDMTGDKAGMIIALFVADYFKNNVVSYCPISTNFIHTSKIIPGDEYKLGKKIIKVTNTDAEGRLILAEALTTLKVTKNDIVITVATLTGCVACAIGKKATGVLTLNDKLANQYLEASKKEKELAWRLPIWDYLDKKYYSKKLIENSVKNIKAGTIEGALFLKQFAKYPENWIHLDIAYSAFDKNKKSNGVPIKSLIRFISLLLK